MDKTTGSKLHQLNDFDELDQEDEHRQDQIDLQIVDSVNKIKNRGKTSTANNFRWLECLLIFVLLALVLYLYRQQTNHLAAVQDQIKNIPIHPASTASTSPDVQKVNQLSNLKKQTTVILDQKALYEWKKSQFKIPPQFWTFQMKNPNLLQTLIRANNKRFAQNSSFTVNVLNLENYQKFLSEEGTKKIKHTLQVLNQRLDRPQGNLKNHISAIQKKLILLHILYENGGVVLEDLLTLTENFDWIRQINSNVYVNRGNPGVEPKVVGFYSPYYSSPTQKQNKKLYPGMEEVDKYMALIPTMENYFLAAQKGADFIKRLIEECISILLIPEAIKRDIAEEKYNYIHLNDHDVYYQYFMLACQRVLLKRQDELDSASTDPSTRSFAIDSFGLNLLNCYYGPYKSSILFDSVQSEKKIQSIARLDMQQLQASIGPIKYLTSTSVFKQLNDFVTRLINGNLKDEKGVMKGSFIQKMYFPDAKEAFLYENTENAFFIQNQVTWDDLSTTAWVYWEAGFGNISNVPAEVLLSVANIKKTAAFSKFTYREVTGSNLKEYLDAQTIDQIESAMKNAKMKTHDQTKSQLIRLALLYKFGGVFMDPTTITTQEFDWIVNIGKYPSQYIYNRYGQNPSVLMFFNPNFGGLYKWQINQAQHTKTEWRLSFLNGFIAANKGSEFIKEWFDLFLQLLVETPSKNMATFEQCGISSFKGTSQNNHGALSKDALKCVLGRRQKKIESQKEVFAQFKDSMDYYKLWSMSSLLGFFKIRTFTNYDNLDRKGLNYYLTRYSQEYAQGIIGKINFFTKIVNEQRAALSNFLLANSDNLLQQTHSQSLFRKCLYNKKWNKFQKINEQVVVKLQ